MTLTHRLPRLVIPATLCGALATGALLRAQGQPAPAPASLAGAIGELRQHQKASGEVPWMVIVGLSMPLIITLGFVSVLITTLATVAVFLRCARQA